MAGFSRLAIPLIAIVAILVVGEALSPGFAAPRQVFNQLTVASFLGLVVVGQTLVILAGGEGIDLSVGAAVSLGALVAGNVMNGSDAMILPALAASALTGAAIGLVNGIGVTRLRIPALVMTLGSTGVITGILILMTNGKTSGRSAELLSQMVAPPLLFGISGIVYLWILVGALATFVLHKSRFGYSLVAVGANEQAAAMVGLSVPWIRLAAYVGCSSVSALAGFFLIGYTGSVFVSIGNQFVLTSIIAVVIGGTALSGGSGGFVGGALGAVVLTLLQSVLIPLNVAEFGRQMIFGLTLIAFMVLYGREPKST